MKNMRHEPCRAWARPSVCLAGMVVIAGLASPARGQSERFSLEETPSLSGEAFLEELLEQPEEDRAGSILAAVTDGATPEALWELMPVTVEGETDQGPVTVTFYVTADYLAIGSTRDYARLPVGLPTAWRLVRSLGYLIPTAKMVDAVHADADTVLTPNPFRPSAHMRSFATTMEHHTSIEDELRERETIGLVAGHKKDVVLTRRLVEMPGRVAIYGWHRPDGRAIQPVSTYHGEWYYDYSHGIRLVSQVAFVDGQAYQLEDILRDPELAPILSDNGAIGDVIDFLDERYP